MQLLITVPAFICLVVSTYCQPARYYGHDGPSVVHPGSTDQNKDGPSGAIVKRALSPLAIIGKEAAEYLLNGARFLKVDGAGYRLFVKKGRLKDARRDFKAVKPTNQRNAGLHSKNFKITGTVGDRRIQIRNNIHDDGLNKFPNVIIDMPGESPIKIIYKN